MHVHLHTWKYFLSNFEQIKNHGSTMKSTGILKIWLDSTMKNFYSTPSLNDLIIGFSIGHIRNEGNILFYIWNDFLEALIKFQTSWQWQWHYGKYYRNYCCFTIVWQLSNEHCKQISYSICKNWIHVTSGSCIM